jgi:hypothetical protein
MALLDVPAVLIIPRCKSLYCYLIRESKKDSRKGYLYESHKASLVA